MKKIVLVICGIFVTAMAKGQVVTDNFQVGPYEVDYLGKGDVNFRLKKGVNLYEYFGLKKDTVIMETKKENPVKRAFEIGVLSSTPMYGSKGAFNSYGLSGTAKTRVCNSIYLNYGGIIAFSYGHYNEKLNGLKDILLEVGAPLSVELTNLDYNKSTLFAIIGITPTFYSTLSAKESIGNKNLDIEKKSGFYCAPKLEVGGYIPVNGHLIKVGVYGEYRVCFSKEEDNIFKERIGRAFVGAIFGYVF